METCDLLIIGAGGAGLAAALEASERGVSVIVASKSFPNRSQTGMAQGGMNAALGNAGADGPDVHLADTLKGAAGIGSQEAGILLTGSAPEAVRWLDGLGMPFGRNPEGRIAQRPFGGAGTARTCYAGDMTGHHLLHTLYDQALRRDSIRWMEERTLLELLPAGEGWQALFWSLAEGKVESVAASALVLASGGYAGIYHNATTNSAGSVGDGVIAAAKAGALLRDMEMVQFHPTTLQHSSVLISEAARGAGAKLVDEKGERFVDELATRDVVARAIAKVEAAGGQVFLDMRSIDPQLLETTLHQEVRLAQTFEGVDPRTDPVPVKPSAHFTMGGVAVTPETEVIGENGVLPGFYACGECACSGVHGANRLGGNALLEIVVFGRKAGEKGAAYARGKTPSPDPDAAERWEKSIAGWLEREGEPFAPIRTETGKVMNRLAGMFRSGLQLEEAEVRLRNLEERWERCRIGDGSRKMNTALVEALETGSALAAARAVVRCALWRKESRGAHSRTDFPETSEAFRHHSLYDTDRVVKMEDPDALS